jgi:hypothetical protein
MLFYNYVYGTLSEPAILLLRIAQTLLLIRLLKPRRWASVTIWLMVAIDCIICFGFVSLMWFGCTGLTFQLVMKHKLNVICVPRRYILTVGILEKGWDLTITAILIIYPILVVSRLCKPLGTKILTLVLLLTFGAA